MLVSSQKCVNISVENQIAWKEAIDEALKMWSIQHCPILNDVLIVSGLLNSFKLQTIVKDCITLSDVVVVLMSPARTTST
jgi:hypothetical protein